MYYKKNYISSLILQLVTMLCGLILPRLIIKTFGSEVNGLCSSITQFLSFITLLEGGLGAVVLAELYNPIEEKNDKKIKMILHSCRRFFRKLSLIFVLYTLVLSIFYPFIVNKSFSITYIISLIWILSITTLTQYMFSITNKLLLQASQKIYIVNYVCIFTSLLNLVIAFIIIYIYPDIHLIKLMSAIIYLLQPLVYRKYIDKKFLSLNHDTSTKEYLLKNKWSGFTQNLAYFINMNVDIVIITIFLSLKDVSVYSIYMLPIIALRGIVISLTGSYQSALGQIYARGEKENLKNKFHKFEKSFWIISMILMFTCLLLINQFVNIYTSDINDANYYQPIFAMIIIIANLFYCIREPYRLLVLSCGKFKETNFGSILEAFLNLLLSVILVNICGMIGVAIGTLVAMIYRLLSFNKYLKHDIINIEYNHYIVLYLTLIITMIINIMIYIYVPLNINTFIEFIIAGIIIFASEVAVVIFIYYLFNKIFTKIKNNKL